MAGQGGLIGTLESIEGDTLTINTIQGPLQATIDQNTAVQMFTEVEASQLNIGVQVTVLGEPGEDGALSARTILISPEGTGGLFGGRGSIDELGRSERPGRGQGARSEP